MWGRLPPRLLCSRHNPAFLQRTGSGSHLYTANLHTLRSVHRVEVLLALVGTHISWSPHPPLLCFHYSTLLAICQALFCQVLYFSEKILNENLVKRGWAGVTISQLTWSYRLNLSDLFSFPSLLYPYCITTWVICQEVFYSFARVFCEECLISLH